MRTAEKYDAMKSQRIKMNFRKINIITGHYGSGKTNVSVNMALDLAEKGEQVTVVDLDIVNPYFRTADFKELFGEHNISLTVPTYANSNLDIPALTGKAILLSTWAAMTREQRPLADTEKYLKSTTRRCCTLSIVAGISQKNLQRLYSLCMRLRTHRV